MVCAPSVFQDGAGYTTRDIISSAIESCKCMGYRIDGINLSALGEGEDVLLGQACYSGTPTRQAEPTEEKESSASDNAGTQASVTSTAQEDASISSQASATFIPATRSSTAGTGGSSASSGASSTSASVVGAVSTVRPQQILSFFVAIAASAMSLSYVS